MGITAKVVADSISLDNKRLTTMVWRYPRFVHSEVMTHRTFCLAGDSMLEFELPAGNHGKRRRVYKLTLADFVSKWLNGSRSYIDRWGNERSHDLRSRLQEMKIRQLDEVTGDISLSTIVDAIESGIKEVWEVRAGKYKIAGSLDHRILTQAGWKTIGELHTDDFLVVSTRNKPDKLRLDSDRLRKIGGRWRSRWQLEQRVIMVAVSPLCRDCSTDHGTEIHHIVPVYEAPERAFDPDNITLVCDQCHDERHRKQGWQTGVPLYSGLMKVDSISIRGLEATYDLSIAGMFPNFLANGVVVHNSRNAASSRAIPIQKMLEQVRNDPALPIFWGKNQAGMQSREELSESDKANALAEWHLARIYALQQADQLSKVGLHKQTANRLLEPFMWMETIVTATDWGNFFNLRRHPDAQPEFKALADAAFDAMRASSPIVLAEGRWHLPFVSPEERHDLFYDELLKLSVARCARVSYKNHDKSDPDTAKDIELHDRLLSSGHMSPFEHQATPYLGRHANFNGWKQYRSTLPNENRTEYPGL